MRIVVLAMVIALSACAGEKPVAKKPMTQRERDSALGESRIPGAQGVRGALRAQDSIEARNNRLDTLN